MNDFELYLRAGSIGTVTKIGEVEPRYQELSGHELFELLEKLFGLDSETALLSLRACDPSKNLVTLDLVGRGLDQLSRQHGAKIKTLLLFLEDLIVDFQFSPYRDFIEKFRAARPNVDLKIYCCERGLNSPDYPVEYFDYFLAELSLAPPYRSPISREFQNKILCLNRRYADHRYLASAVLINYESAVFSQYYSLNPSEINGKIKIQEFDSDLRDLVIQGLAKLESRSGIIDSSIPVDKTPGDTLEYISDQARRELDRATEQSFCSLVTESKFDNTANFSEKTLRPIQVGRPFLLLAPRATLELLKDLGFKTFGSVWDESYDLEQDQTKRFQAVIRQVQGLLARNDLADVLAELMPILEHNRHHLKNLIPEMHKIMRQHNV